MADDLEFPAAPSVHSPPTNLLSDVEWQAVVKSLQLSARHAAIVGLILQGKRDKQIAADLGMSVWTVRTHLARLFARLEVTDRMELALHILARSRSVSSGQ